MTAELHVATRDPKTENAETLRNEGKLPGVFYGPKEEATPVSMDMAEFLRVWNEVGGSSILDLVGVGENREVLVHDVVWHPVTGKPIHVDFYCFERGKTLTLTVPLVFTGEAPVEKEDGIVVKVMHELEIEVRPRDIPHEIEVDLSALTDLDSSVTVADLKLPEGVQPTDDPEETVLSVTQAKEEPVEEEEERDISDVEIEGEQKEGDDAESGESSDGQEDTKE